jgi:hypothetical protein
VNALKLPPIDTGRLQLGALVVGVIALVGAAILGFTTSSDFFESYLMSFLFWAGLSLGCMALLFYLHLAGGSWGALITRPLEAAASLMPLLALLFIPVLFAMKDLYPWTDPAYVAAWPMVEAKTAYLNTSFFIVRAIVIFAIWTLGAFLYRSLGRKQDEAQGDPGRTGYRMKSMGGLWLVIYIMTMTFAAFDRAMSLTPTWFSGIYPGIFMASQVVSALALIILVMVALARVNPTIDKLLTPKRLQDLGNMLMAITMLWAYFHISQLIIQWSNNISETATWYHIRLGPEWLGVSSFILFFGFFAPFMILFSRWVKRRRRALSIVAVWALLVQLLNIFWMIAPSFGRSGPQVTLLDVLLIIGLGGVWLALFGRALGARNVLPANDPRLVNAVADNHA